MCCFFSFNSFAFIAMALAFALTFAFTEFINLGLCNLCCPRTFYTHPSFVSRVQLYIILAAGLLLGLILGIMFGSMDVEDDWSANHSRLVKMLLYGLIPGTLVGAGMGLVTEFLRDRLPTQAYEPLPVERPVTDARSLPSGYEDI
jgi:cytochrome c biogenesis protein CcdA